MKIINEFEMFATRQLTPDKDIYADIEINISLGYSTNTDP
jgi:hypothetical protein